MKVIGVVCAYNEEKTIKELLVNLRKYVDEILIVVSKKNTDKTSVIAKKYGLVIYDNGKGKGDAIRQSIKYLSMKYDDAAVVYIDADGSHNPKDIKSLVKPVLNNEADIVIGSRLRGGSDELGVGFDGFLRLFFTICINLIIYLRFGYAITDAQNGFRVLKLKSWKNINLKSNITTIEQEECIKGLKAGLKFCEVPSHEYARKSGVSKIVIWKHGVKYFFEVLRDIW